MRTAWLIGSGWLLAGVVLACANGATSEDAFGSAAPAATQTESNLPLPPSQKPTTDPSKKNEDAGSDSGKSSTSSSSGSSSSGSSGASSSGSTSSSSSSGSSSSGSSGSSGSSTSSSSGGAGADCDPANLTYYVEALSELSGPSPKDCPCGAGECCYSGLVCVAQ